MLMFNPTSISRQFVSGDLCSQQFQVYCNLKALKGEIMWTRKYKQLKSSVIKGINYQVIAEN
jgi:hypothetical protein